MKHLFDSISLETSKMVTKSYSTSFSLGIRFLNKDFRNPIYSIYGFVRFADEIVDTFHDFNKKELLDEFKTETYRGIERGISLNPILNSFQNVVNTYKIDHKLIDTFLKSMEMDLEKKSHDAASYKEYILGSAEVVGLMCLRVFVKGDNNDYEKLKPFAMALGSAFQKINFLRDINADYSGMGRIYFPNIEISELNIDTKKELEADIELDFIKGLEGIKLLPKDSRIGVYIAYIYYYKLFNKIKNIDPSEILEKRIRISDSQKIILLASSCIKHKFNLI
jgi:phytoene/squalene synthetase